MRWKTVSFWLALVMIVAPGCKQKCFMLQDDYERMRALGMPPTLECGPPGTSLPPDPAIFSPQPRTVIDPSGEVRHLSLAEAIAMALENGTTAGGGALQIGTYPGLGPGQDNLSLVSLGGVGGSDSIRVLALDPAIVGASIEAALAKFDARWVSNANWTNTDRPVGTSLDQFTAGGESAIRSNQATVSTELIKPLPTGGVAGITFTTNYTLTNLPARVNPSYQPSLQFQFEQPLLQGFGVEINELRAAHPGSLLTPFATGSQLAREGILITRLRFDQQRAEFERQVHNMLATVEFSYWNLYDAYWSLYSQEQAMRQAFEAWRINKARFDAGRVSVADFAQTRGQFELFRDNRLQALGVVLERERELRHLIGLKLEDGKRLVPIDAPTLAPYQPDWCDAQNQALTLRPELVILREDVKFRQLDLINVKNTLLPDLRFTSTYDINGIGTRLDSSDNNALKSLASDHFNNWTLGLRLEMPLGYRDANAAVRVARLNLARSYFSLRQQEDSTVHLLGQQYRELFETYAHIGTLRAQREAFAEQLRSRFLEYLAGRGTLDILLEAQRFWATALASEYHAIAQYNIALVAFEYAKGTIMQYDNVAVSEGPLPHCAQVRAVEHERERTKALVVRERENPVPHPSVSGDPGVAGLPDLSRNAAPSLPSLLQGAPSVPQNLPETLPTPKPLPADSIPGTPPPTTAPEGGVPTAPAPSDAAFYAPIPTGPPEAPPSPGEAQPVPTLDMSGHP